MCPVRPMLLEHDVVTLDVPMAAFDAGTIGTIVSILDDDHVLIEVSDERGWTVDEIFVARTDRLTFRS